MTYILGKKFTFALFQTVYHRRKVSHQTPKIRNPLLNSQLKQVRTRLQSVLTHRKSIAEIEGVTSKTITSLCLQLIANESKYSSIIEVCKKIVESGTWRKHNTQLLERKSSFLLDSLYWNFKVPGTTFFKGEQVFISSYNKVTKFREDSCLVNELWYFDKAICSPVGIYHSYQSIALQTISQIIETERLQDANYPLIAELSDGLDGSGSHTIYTTKCEIIQIKNVLLFAFKAIRLKDLMELFGQIHFQFQLSP